MKSIKDIYKSVIEILKRTVNLFLLPGMFSSLIVTFLITSISSFIVFNTQISEPFKVLIIGSIFSFMLVSYFVWALKPTTIVPLFIFTIFASIDLLRKISTMVLPVIFLAILFSLVMVCMNLLAMGFVSLFSMADEPILQELSSLPLLSKLLIMLVPAFVGVWAIRLASRILLVFVPILETGKISFFKIMKQTKKIAGKLAVITGTSLIMQLIGILTTTTLITIIFDTPFAFLISVIVFSLISSLLVATLIRVNYENYIIVIETGGGKE